MGNLQSQVPRRALCQIPPGQCLGSAGRGATQRFHRPQRSRDPPGDGDSSRRAGPASAKATAEEPQPRPCGLSPACGAQAGKPWCCSPKAVGFDLFCSCRLVFHGLDELGIRALAWDVRPGWLPRPARGFLSDRDEVTLILYLEDEDCISAH